MIKKLFYFILMVAILIAVHALDFIYFKPRPHKLNLRKVAFAELPGWEQADIKRSLLAFQLSCKTFLKQDPNQSVGSHYLDLHVKDWQPACREALLVNVDSNDKIKQFFQTWFTPVEFFDKKPVDGTFTGYYMSLLYGSLTRSKEYNVPIYGLPKDLITINLSLFDPKLKHHPNIVGRLKGQRILPYYTRAAINKGAIDKVAPVIAWVNNSVDRSFMEIQGSGAIKLSNGSQIIVNYAAENGAPYSSIAKVLIDQGVMTKDNASMQHIRNYFSKHPERQDAVLNKNKSFVFFSVFPHEEALGSQGVILTPGYSLAVDRKWVPLGAPVWLDTTKPDLKSSQQTVFQRLMIAQDTGGAIRGAVRGDVYWGAGERATKIAGRMKNKGHYWLLLPSRSLERMKDKIL